MPDILKTILDVGVKEFGGNPLVILFILLLLGAFFWLNKELRSQQIEEKELQKERVEKSLTALTEILYEGGTYKNGEDINSFLRVVYLAVPFMDYKISKEILEVLDEEFSVDLKVQKITKIVKEETLFLSGFSNNYLFKPKLLTEDIEKFFNKLRRIFGPVLTSFFIIYSGLLLLTISLSGETQFWMVTKPFSFMIACLLVPFGIDLLLEKKLTLPLTGLLSGLCLSAVLTGISEEYSSLFFVVFIILFIGLVFYGYKLTQRNIDTTVTVK